MSDFDLWHMMHFPSAIHPSAVMEKFRKKIFDMEIARAFTLLKGLSDQIENQNGLRFGNPNVEYVSPYLCGCKIEPFFDDYGLDKCRKFIEEIIAETSERAETSDTSFSKLKWAVEDLITDPCKALCSWEKAYDLYQDYNYVIDRATFDSFNKSTLFLLSNLIPGLYATCTIPAEFAIHLFDAFEYIEDAYFIVYRLYAHSIKETYSTKETYKDYLVYENYHIALPELSLGIDILFDHIKSELNIVPEAEIEEEIKDTITSTFERFYNQLPFAFFLTYYLTKAYAELCFTEAGRVIMKEAFSPSSESEDALVDFIIKQVVNGEKYVNLFSSHKHAQGKDLTKIPSANHPLILFMKDISNWLYLNDNKDANRSFWPTDLGRNDANWYLLSLYLYRRFSVDPFICVDNCNLTLPALLSLLFCVDLSIDEDDEQEAFNKDESGDEFNNFDDNDIDAVIDIRAILAIYDNRLVDLPRKNISVKKLRKNMNDFLRTVTSDQVLHIVSKNEYWQDSNSLDDNYSKMVSKWIASTKTIMADHKNDASLYVRRYCIEYLVSSASRKLEEYVESLIIPNEIFRVMERLENLSD